MQKWGKRPIYFKNAEIMQNALIMQTLRPLHCGTDVNKESPSKPSEFQLN